MSEQHFNALGKAMYEQAERQYAIEDAEKYGGKMHTIRLRLAFLAGANWLALQSPSAADVSRAYRVLDRLINAAKDGTPWRDSWQRDAAQKIRRVLKAFEEPRPVHTEWAVCSLDEDGQARHYQRGISREEAESKIALLRLGYPRPEEITLASRLVTEWRQEPEGEDSSAS